MTISSPRTWLAGMILFVAVAALCFVWGRAIPRGQAPDEPDHLAMVEWIAAAGRLPRYGVEPFTIALVTVDQHRAVARPGNHRGLHAARIRNQPLTLVQPYALMPPWAYALAGITARMLGNDSLTDARAASALCIAAAALATFIAGLALWPGRMFAAWVAGACLGLWPQITFLGAYANDDAFAIATSAILVATCAVLQRRAFDRTSAIALGAALGLVVSSKPYAWALLPLAVIWLVGFGRDRLRRGEVDRQNLRRRLAWTLGVTLAIASPWMIRNAALYEGDPTGRRVLMRDLRAFVAELPPDVQQTANTLSLRPPHTRGARPLTDGVWWHTSLESAWARFGWMNIVPPRWVTRSGLVLLGIGLLASLLALGRDPERRARVRESPVLFALPALLLLVAASLANSSLVDNQPQGRYLLPAAPACILLLAGSLGARTARAPRAGDLALVALLAFFGLQNWYCRFAVL